MITRALKSYDGHACHWCKRPMDIETSALAPTRDHFPIPRSRGGARTVIACRTCNEIKADMGAAEWTGFMAVNPNWWTRKPPKNDLPRATRRRGVRFIKMDEQPSQPMRAALEQHQLVGLLRRGFDEKFGRDSE